MERNTRQREAVLAAVGQAGRALTPAEILALAQNSVPTLNLSTIYRQLASLQADSRILKVVLPGQAARFEAACGDAGSGPDAASDADRERHHHHHFHCRRCDRVYALHGCPGPLDDLAPKGYTVEGHDITLRGVCAACAGAGE